MPVKQTVLFSPPLQPTLSENSSGSSVSDIKKWLFSLQYAHPLNTVDTSAGNEMAAPPPAGLNSSTGQSNQNQELVYTKISSDANTFTLAGNNLPLGPYTLTTQGEVLRIKSDGTNWYKSN